MENTTLCLSKFVLITSKQTQSKSWLPWIHTQQNILLQSFNELCFRLIP